MKEICLVFEYKGIKIRWLGHDSFVLDNYIKIIIDPYKITKHDKADLVLVSHNHFDHLSVDDLKNVCTEKTVIVAANECINMITGFAFKEKIGMFPGQEKTILGTKIRAVPAYNLDKINPDTRKPFHPKEDNKVGFVIQMGDVVIYHTGDTDLIPEMTDIQPDIALVPVSGTYVMTAKEASQAISKIKPKIAIPMHYGTIVGSSKDADDLKEMVTSCQIQILEKEK
ncbi:Zn-dependent hydrolase of the beta-lactamase fold protein [Nitrosotalea sinensis]|uniref:Zn-dependent hydrolase of the beta-lactamase fold protein n=1 Tax=Nitrosotalea sinensis TaxID=1499975 RepID=A0A2H1EEG7_9ARCH|nr:Zn-dependent hydrolase of the beta-lactamase fold protein [Candidatus Nitrosotalea sinensis]